MNIPDDTPFEVTEGIARLFMAPGMPRASRAPGAEPTTVILVTDEEPPLSPILQDLLARHRRGAETPASSMFRVGIDSRMVVVVMHTETVPDLRECLYHISSIRMMRQQAAGPGLLTFVCLEEEWAEATGGIELPIQNRCWPRDN